MGDVVSKIMPILLLISLGYYLQRKEILKQDSIDEIKKIVINIGLPSLLFLTFKDMELRVELFLVSLIIFFMLCSFYAVGIGLNRIKRISHSLVPFIIPGRSFANIGIPLYVTVFGIDRLSNYSILAIGHEIFLWFVFYTLLKIKLTGESFSINFFRDIIKSPFILAVLSGIILNATGINSALSENIIFSGIEMTIKYLGDLSNPLILIVIGYDLKFNKYYMKQSIKLLSIRLLVTLTIGYAVKYVLLNSIMGVNPLFDYAYFTFLIIPPPFSLPLFVAKYGGTDEQKNLITNTVVLSTLVGIILYVIFVLLI